MTNASQIPSLGPGEISDADLDQIAAGTNGMASNNVAVLAQKPTFLSILQDSGTGLPSNPSSPTAGGLGTAKSA